MATQLKAIQTTPKIEKGIPLPAAQSSGSGPAPKYPISQLEVGDSFFAPLSLYDCRSGAPTLRKFAATMSRLLVGKAKNGRKYSLRKERDGLRIWRIA